MASIINASSTGSGGIVQTADASGVLQLQTNGTAALTVATSGNVGIGTSSPVDLLQVNRSSGSGITSGISLTTAAGSVGDGSYIKWTGATAAEKIARIDGVQEGTDAGSIRFNTGNGSDGFAERARIDSSGNLLVGTTSANGRVSSTPKAGFNPAGLAGGWATAPAISASGGFGGGVSWVDSSGGYCAWVDDGGNDFNIAGGLVANVVGNGVFLNGYAATAWSARSDERLKDKFEPITDAVNKVGSLRAVTGVYKNFPEDRQAFLFAQDVQKVLPEAVSVADKKSPEQYLGLAYTQVIPLLVAAIQELKALVDAQGAEIATLKGAQL